MRVQFGLAALAAKLNAEAGTAPDPAVRAAAIAGTAALRDGKKPEGK